MHLQEAQKESTPESHPSRMFAEFDNWGVPAGTPTIPKRKITDITSSCSTWREGPMDALLLSAMLMFFPNSSQRSLNHGIDMLSATSSYYGWGFNFRNQGYSLSPFDGPAPLARLCDEVQPDGSTWTIHQIGPFDSTGGYDWWKFGWADALHFGRRFVENVGLRQPILPPPTSLGPCWRSLLPLRSRCSGTLGCAARKRIC